MKKEKLSNLTLSITDGKHGDCADEKDSGYYFISCKDIYNDSINYDGARQIREDDFIDTHRRTKLEPHDILLTNSGTIGRMAYVQENSKTSRTTFQKSVAIIKPNSSIINSKYLYYVLKSSINWLIGEAHGTAQKNLLLSTLRDFQLNIEPSPQVQAKIADVLSSYDNLIENNKKQIKLLEEAAQRLYKEWFVDFRFPGHENVKIIDGVPEGWSEVSINDLGEYLNGYAFKPSDWGDVGYPIIKIKEMNDGISDSTPRNNGGDIPEKYIVNSGDILFSWSATLSVLIWGDEKGLLNQHIFKVKPRNGISREFIYQSILIVLDKFRNITTGATMKHIQRGKLKEIHVLLPCSEIMDKWDEISSPIRLKILLLKREISLLSEARNRLLPKLMNGEIEVTP